MENDFQIGIVFNRTTTHMYAIDSQTNEPVSIPSDGGISYQDTGPGLKIPVANTAQDFANQSFPIFCVEEDPALSSEWHCWSYYITTSTVGTGPQTMQQYELREIYFLSTELPDATDTASHYPQAVCIAKIGVLDQLPQSSRGLALPREFAVRAVKETVDGTSCHRLGAWVIGAISTGIIG